MSSNLTSMDGLGELQNLVWCCRRAMLGMHVMQVSCDIKFTRPMLRLLGLGSLSSLSTFNMLPLSKSPSLILWFPLNALPYRPYNNKFQLLLPILHHAADATVFCTILSDLSVPTHQFVLSASVTSNMKYIRFGNQPMISMYRQV